MPDITLVQDTWRRLRAELDRFVIGMEDTKEELFIALVSQGHILLEGAPGIAKTTLAKTFAGLLDLSFKRIQFTPDLLPTDITGVKIYNQKTGEFEVRLGPIFANIVLADEINRAGPKTQSALLESMQELQITIEGEVYRLPRPFMTIATQNPIEVEGTYPLPSAQLDRFMIKNVASYPPVETYIEVMKLYGGYSREEPRTIVSRAEVEDMQRMIDHVTVSEDLYRYIGEIIEKIHGDSRVRWSISPRAALHLIRGAKAYAMMNGRDYVAPEDIKRLIKPVFTHRIILTPEASFKGHRAEDVIDEAIRAVRVPI